jgi:hypothetical protein
MRRMPSGGRRPADRRRTTGRRCWDHRRRLPPDHLAASRRPPRPAPAPACGTDSPVRAARAPPPSSPAWCWRPGCAAYRRRGSRLSRRFRARGYERRWPAPAAGRRLRLATAAPPARYRLPGPERPEPPPARGSSRHGPADASGELFRSANRAAQVIAGFAPPPSRADAGPAARIPGEATRLAARRPAGVESWLAGPDTYRPLVLRKR